VILNARLPLEFFEARNALRIAQSEGAEQYANDSYQRAVQLMNNADEYATSKHIDTKPLIAVSRDAVQTAEDAREIAVKKLDEIRLANERQHRAMHRRNRRRKPPMRCNRRTKLSLTRREIKQQRLRRNRMRRKHAPTLPAHERQPRKLNPIWPTARPRPRLHSRRPKTMQSSHV